VSRWLRITLALDNGIHVFNSDDSNGTQDHKLNVDLSADETKAEPHMSYIDAIFDLPAHGESQKLLSRISWLNSESVRTSDEKLALATTAYDLVRLSYAVNSPGYFKNRLLPVFTG
jgi:hypothetical protein